MGYKIIEAKAELDYSKEKLNQVTHQYELEQERTEEIAEETKFRRTLKYIEKVAREKLGLVYEDEIILKPE